MQDKAATLFSTDIGSAVKGSQAEQDPSMGLFVGEKAVRAKSFEASMEDELLARTTSKPNRATGGEVEVDRTIKV